jgi:hypothetical protein
MELKYLWHLATNQFLINLQQSKEEVKSKTKTCKSMHLVEEDRTKTLQLQLKTLMSSLISMELLVNNMKTPCIIKSAP